MRLFGVEIARAAKAAPEGKAATALSLDQLIQRLEAAYQTGSGVAVTPDNCMRAPTVHAIVTGVTRAFTSMPLHVYRKSVNADGLAEKERQPDHPVQRLLNKPNDWQSPAEYWNDVASRYMRYGNFYAFKARGVTGPVRRLVPFDPANVTVEQNDDWSLVYKVTQPGGGQRELSFAEMHHIRGPARNGYQGDSPVMDMRETIALEIAAEAFGAVFFGNGALPSILFNYREGFQGFKSGEEENAFLEDFREKFRKRERLGAMLPPPGLEMTPVDIQNDKAQFLETRKLQRTFIAGGFGIPPHIVGDLERGIRANIEQQSLDWVQKVILPIARIFEAAMERDLLTVEDRRAGIVIRFNIDALLRGDQKSQQESLEIMRRNGVISPDEWREEVGRNPRPDGMGGTYWDQGPSGQTSGTSDPAADPAAKPNGAGNGLDPGTGETDPGVIDGQAA